ncbi:glycosyltransferase family 2 protein [Pseudorhodoplanes sp.]|uniref:glycosyltransferase family 2 protein n=1 Tax=Pseudorhodoplanes sp. TaxID=1934341 RepID=UPI002B6BBBB9|nr:glycosyltransferase family 2 protein [Pseudorhodoplanes sp.]HWV54941.1 glycosyltransferase family 2 protein [Pseudorhodoplanes sp.]
MPTKAGQDGNTSAAAARKRAERTLSIVVPCFNEADNLPAVHARLCETAQMLRETRGLKIEVVYIDDGSRDSTYAVASALPAIGLDVQTVSLSRNFGKEAALMAGLHHARYGAILFMDGDGQHPPALIERLVGHWIDDGYDVVYTAKAHRDQEPLLRRAGVKTFYALMNFRSRHKIPEDAGDFRLLSPRAANALRQLPERNRFFKGLASWIGFRQLRVDYEPAERAHGRTSWNLGSLIGLSIEGLTSFSVAPLRVASLLGVLLATGALIFGMAILYETLIYGKSVPGYPSVVVGLMVLGGVQLIMIGVLGEYIGKILSEQKARPVYFVAEHQTRSEAREEASEDRQPGAAA